MSWENPPAKHEFGVGHKLLEGYFNLRGWIISLTHDLTLTNNALD